MIKQTVKFIKKLLDTKLQSEISRLATKAGRRCVRDFAHAIAHIPDEDPCKKVYEERVTMWKQVFWNCSDYRDELHLTIYKLEADVKALENQLTEAGITPVTTLPF